MPSGADCDHKGKLSLDGGVRMQSAAGYDAVLEGDKIYFPLVASPEYRDVIHGDCALGILVS